MPTKKTTPNWRKTLTRVFLCATVLVVTSCSKPASGTYSLQEIAGLAPEVIQIENKSVWVTSGQQKTEYRLIIQDENLRVESLDSQLYANFRLLESGLLCIESNKFYRKVPNP